MRKAGKRTLAGLAASALAFTGLAFVAAPSASAAQTALFYCVGNDTGINGNPGNGLDPTTVQPNCSVIASGTAGTPISLTEFGTNAVEGAGYGVATIDGPGVWVLDTDTVMANDGVVTNGGKTLTLDVGEWGGDEDTPETFATRAFMTVPSTGAATVSFSYSTAGAITQVNSSNTTPVGDLTVTGIGATAGIVVSPAYKVLQADAPASGLPAAGDASVALVQVRDETGANVAITADNVVLTAPSVAWTEIDAVTANAPDCNANGTFADAGADAQNPYDLQQATPACLALTSGIGAGPGVWINVQPPAGFVGNATIGVTVTSGVRTYTGSVTFTVSSPLAAAWNLSFDKATYVPGELADLTICAVDLGGRPIPDGLGTGTTLVDETPEPFALRRDLVGGAFNADVIDASDGAVIGDASVLFPVGVDTYEGCVTGSLFVPGTPMTLRASVTSDAALAAPAGTPLSASMWANSAANTTNTASAVIAGEVPPTPATIMIEGIRGAGNENRTVFVEGTTTNLVGATVTPFYRFPGQVGFTAGTGVRTVDTEGNFAWQRKTGKRIAVQFRTADGLQSNSIIIEANTR